MALSIAIWHFDLQITNLKIARYSSKVHILVTSLNCSLTKLLLHYTIIQLYQHACQPPQNLS